MALEELEEGEKEVVREEEEEEEARRRMRSQISGGRIGRVGCGVNVGLRGGDLGKS